MAFNPTLLGLTPIASAPSTAVNEWDVTAEVDDPTDQFSAFDAAIGDVIFTDFISSTSSPDTVGRYTLQAIVSRSATVLRGIWRWGGVGDAVDPVEAAGQRGYLAKASLRNGFAWHPRSNRLMVPQRVIDGARNTEAFAVTDALSDSGGGSSGVDQTARDRQTRVIATSQVFNTGQVVSLRGGALTLAEPSDDLLMPAFGIVLSMGIGNVLIQTGGTTPSLPYALEPGKPVFVGAGGALTQNAEAVPRPGHLQHLGVAAAGNAVTLAITGMTVKRV